MLLDGISVSPADLAAWSAALDDLEGVPHGPAAVRAESLRKHRNSLDLGCELNAGLRRTPALELLADELERVISVPGARLIVSFSPQEGKTWSLRRAIIRKLQRNPESRNAIASYAETLARTSGREIRRMIETFGSGVVDPVTRLPSPDLLGIQVARDHAAAADWSLSGHVGGLVCVGVGSGLTGRPIDGLLAVDDPIKDARDADSPVIRSRLHDWWMSVSETRLAPEASVVVVATRWHEEDLSGWLIEQEKGLPGDQREWRVVNIPALADGHAPDALGRPVGEWMDSVRGRTPQDWVRIRRRVGDRVFAAMFQGMPSPPKGVIFQSAWFDRDRVAERPPDSLPPIVVVDPADNMGDGDEAGVLVASVDMRQRIYLGPDYSGHMTTARWVRVALLAVVRHRATAIAYEKSLSGLARSIKAGWERLYKQAKILKRLVDGSEPPGLDGPPDERVVGVALTELCHPDDPRSTWDQTSDELIELWPLVAGVLTYPVAGPVIRLIVPRGTKQWRAQIVAPMYEDRRVSHVGYLSELEWQQVTWQPGQDSPDRMDTAVHSIHLLGGGSTAELSTPSGRVPTRSVRHQPRTATLPRSARR